jgi:hypothetical protein
MLLIPFAPLAGPKFLEIRIIEKERNNEDTDINSNIGVIAHGIRPDGATRERDDDAGANEGTADYCAGEREEETRARAQQTAGKT